MTQTTQTALISSIADVRTGYTFRERISENKHGNAHVLQLKDARQIWEQTNSATINVDELPKIFWDGKSKAFAEPNSILLPSKGSYLRASKLVSNQDSLPTVVSGQFLTLKVKDSAKQHIHSDYLCWVLNQPETQRLLAESSQGTKIMMLSAKAVKDVTIKIPSLETQTKVMHLNEMWEKEQKLINELLINRQKMVQGTIQQLLKETN